MSREIATGLRGRSVSYEVFPLSFAEFLRFRKLKYQPYSRASESTMVSALEDYLSTGGLPEVVLADESLRPRILKEYVDLIFYRDLVERYRVGNPMVLRQLLRHCLGHPASLFSTHKLYQDLRSQGIHAVKGHALQLSRLSRGVFRRISIAGGGAFIAQASGKSQKASCHRLGAGLPVYG